MNAASRPSGEVTELRGAARRGAGGGRAPAALHVTGQAAGPEVERDGLAVGRVLERVEREVQGIIGRVGDGGERAREPGLVEGGPAGAPRGIHQHELRSLRRGVAVPEPVIGEPGGPDAGTEDQRPGLPVHELLGPRVVVGRKRLRRLLRPGDGDSGDGGNKDNGRKASHGRLQRQVVQIVVTGLRKELVGGRSGRQAMADGQTGGRADGRTGRTRRTSMPGAGELDSRRHCEGAERPKQSRRARAELLRIQRFQRPDPRGPPPGDPAGRAGGEEQQAHHRDRHQSGRWAPPRRETPAANGRPPAPGRRRSRSP